MEKDEKILTGVKIDTVDKGLLNALLENSRLSFRELAKETGVSAVTIMNRLKVLNTQGIIRSHTTELDYEKLGYDIQVIIRLRISKGKLIEVEKKIATMPAVSAVYDTTGDFDTTVIARFKNRKAMDGFLKKIQTYDFVERTDTSLVLNTIKEQPIRLQ